MKIKKELIGFFKNYKIFNGIPTGKILAWLEKQAPFHLSHDDEIMIRQLTEYFTTGKGLQNTNDTVVEWLEDVKRKLEKQGEQKQDPCEHCKDKCLNCNNFPCIDKRTFEQGKTVTEAITEEKVDNTNKVEHKFKVGDWVLKKDGKHFSNGDRIAQITKIDGDKYWFNFGTYLRVEQMRHWTLEDARVGDIIYVKSNKLEEYSGIRIFFKLEDGKSWAYCNISSTDSVRWDFSISKGYLKLDKYNFFPATKEQCDLLFRRLKEEGYEWNSEKKEVIRIY